MAERRRSQRNSRVSNDPYIRPSSAPLGAWRHDRAPDDSIPAAKSLSTDKSGTIVVSNLHYEVSTEDLNSIFKSVGTLGRVPAIKYDRSGRSLGIAYVNFVNAKDAELAVAKLDGVAAKGQPMKINLEQVRRGPFGAPGPSPKASLLNRLSSAPLANRLAPKNAPTGPAASNSSSGRADRGGPRGKSQSDPKTAKKPTNTRTPNVPKTVEDLDRELEAYLEHDAPSAEAPSSKAATTINGGEDVDMV